MIEKLTEFAKNGEKNTEQLDLNNGFPSKLQPARQWMNWLFNKLSLKINEIIDESAGLDENKVNYTDIVDNLTSSSSSKPLSAKMGKKLNDEKLSKSDLGKGNAPIYGVRAWVNFNGQTGEIRASGNIKSVTRNGTGSYTVVFDKEMEDANYAVTTSATVHGDASSLNLAAQSKSEFTLVANYGGDNTVGNYDPFFASVAVVR